ncbi:hypothetical protein HCA44_01650 [Rhodococcus sp. HNM0569]|nr:hypothetical protein [Rhodococcus sp. HNM0569]NLU81483.1 hypothetical protein [Rhodococcus sp. HNM0569]
MSRRTALRAAATVAGAAGLVPLTAACGDDEPAPLDPLIEQESRARDDAAAASAAIALAPDRTAALSAVSAQRTAHAEALRREIDRAAGVTPDPNAPATTTPVAPAAPLGVDELRTRLSESLRSASALATSESGYRAGLLASVSASCRSHVEVLLP